MADRKAVMAQRSDAFVALPGSYGTLDEFYTVLSEEKLMGGEARPIALYNVDGFYDPLAELDRRMVADGLLAPEKATLYRMFDELVPLMDYVCKR